MKYYIEWEEYTPMGNRLPAGRDYGVTVRCNGTTLINASSQEEAEAIWGLVAPKSKVLALGAA